MGDNSGIYSLAGFAYQIKEFVLQVIELKNGYTLEYETIDDVALKMTADNMDMVLCQDLVQIKMRGSAS